MKKGKKSLFTKKHATVLILILCSLTLMFSGNSVKAQDGPVISQKSQCDFRPSGTVPYIGGFMANDSFPYGNHGEAGEASAVCVTVSFSGTDKSVIQSDNCLAAGIAAQGPDSRNGSVGGQPWIDWGYLLLLVLDGADNYPHIEGAVYKCYEWGRHALWNPLLPLEQPDYDLVFCWTWSYPSILTIDRSVTLKMVWSSDTLNFFATIGWVEYSLFSYTPEPWELHYFKLGTCERWWDGWQLGGWVKWFQFPGAWSRYNICQVGWHSHITSPQFMKTGESSWNSATFAYSLDGGCSYLDHTMRWGGGDYRYVDASYCYNYVHFYPTQFPYGATLEAYTLLWQKPSGGCPTLLVWNGTGYAEEGILNIHADSDITVQHEIQNTLALENGVYKLQLRELDNFTSHIDQVKLYAVDSEGERHLCPLIYAEHNELGKVTWKLLLDDGNRVDLKPTQVIDLKFLPSIPYSETAFFIFEINGYNRKEA